MVDIIVAIIVGVLSLIGVVVSNIASNQKTQNQIQTHVEVTDNKIETLTREVRKHNGFAERVPLIEKDVEFLTERVETLEKDKKN